MMHESRQHSNLWGKMVLWGDEALATDHIGYYSKNKLINAAPTPGHFHEEYPHHSQAWMYTEEGLNAEFNYDDLEAEYDQKEKSASLSKEDLKSQLDQAHQ